MTLDLEAIERTGGYPEDIAPLIAEVRRLRGIVSEWDSYREALERTSAETAPGRSGKTAKASTRRMEASDDADASRTEIREP